MFDVTFKLNTTTEGSLESDFSALLVGEMKDKIANALKGLRDDMRGSLADHVQKDVYDAYKDPNEYERRGLNGGLQGQALNATSHATIESMDGTHYRIYIQFQPDGNHPDSHQWKEPPVHGDDFIGRIENWNPKYPYPPRHRRLPKRPFWKNFVEDMVDNGSADVSFATALRAQDEEVLEDFDVEREPGDGDY